MITKPFDNHIITGPEGGTGMTIGAIKERLRVLSRKLEQDGEYGRQITADAALACIEQLERGLA